MVELGKSKVPLEEDLIKKKIEFVKSWVEWASDNEEQIIKHSAEPSGTNFFTVPANKTLYLSSAFAAGSGTSAGALNLRYLVTGALSTILACVWPAGGSGNNSLSFPMPLKIKDGESLEIGHNNAVQFVLGFQGFIVDKRIS